MTCVRIVSISITACYSGHMAKLTIARALTARVAQRVILIATFIATAVFVAIFFLTWALAYFLSGWWWLLIVPFVFLFVLFLVIRLFVVLIVRQIHSERMSKTQRQALDDFVDKLQALIEARATPLPIVIAICIKDLLFHRDVTTVKKLINDTAGLRRDYADLEKLF